MLSDYNQVAECVGAEIVNQILTLKTKKQTLVKM
jgi:hypothetical protein